MTMDYNLLLPPVVGGLDLMRFEKLLTEFIARELKHREWLGGIMGFLIGIAQSGFTYFWQ